MLSQNRNLLEPVLKAIMWVLNEDQNPQAVTAKSLAEFGEVCTKTIKNWESGSIERIDADVIHRIIARHPSAHVRWTLANAMLQGSDLEPIIRVVVEKVVEKSGRTILEKLTRNLLKHTEELQRAMKDLHDDVLTPAESDANCKAIEDIIHDLRITQAMLKAICQQTAIRRVA